MSTLAGGADEQQKKLYDLIWKRTIASQMSDAELERTTANIENDAGLKFIARGEMISFDGFLKIHLDSSKDENSNLLPKLSQGEYVNLINATATERFSRPPGRFTEATLVKSMEELGIGRPSTYAPTITTIQKRGYVEKGISEGVIRTFSKGSFQNQQWTWETITEKTGSNKGKMTPTDLGSLVTDFLNQHFAPVMDYQFTAKMESDFDLISTGSAPWTEVLSDFYSGFSPLVGKAGDAERESGQRILGVDPKSGKNIYVRLAKFGPVVQLGETTDEEKPKFVGLPKEYGLETVSLEEVLPLLTLPRIVGTYKGDNIIANNGRFGAYVQVNRNFVSLPAEKTPYTVTEDEAIELIIAKAEADAAAQIAVFEGTNGTIEIRNGRFGPYIRQNKNNFKIPKNVKPETITLEVAEKIISEAPVKKTRKSKKSSSKKLK
jgi:DNA topoisomerase-1